MSLNVLLIGEEGAGMQALREVVRSGHRLVGVMTSGSDPASGSALTRAAGELGCAAWPAEHVRQPAFAEVVRSAGVDLLLNVHSLRRVRPEVLAAARIGAFNLHPGPLPAYAGLNAVSWAIYRGEPTHAATLHWMVPEIDAGAIAYSAPVPIHPDDTALALGTRCVRVGVPLITRLLEAAVGGRENIPAVPQDRARRRYYGREVPRVGHPLWETSARELHAFVRACDYHPFPSPWGLPAARIDGREIAVLRVARTGERCAAPPGTVGEVRDGGILVSTADEWVLVRRVRRGGRWASAVEVLRPGQRFERTTRTTQPE